MQNETEKSKLLLKVVYAGTYSFPWKPFNSNLVSAFICLFKAYFVCTGH